MLLGDIQRRWSEGEDGGIDSERTAAQKPDGKSAKDFASSHPLGDGQEAPIAVEGAATAAATAVVTVTSDPHCSIIPPPSVVEAAHQSGHVIRLHVKSKQL